MADRRCATARYTRSIRTPRGPLDREHIDSPLVTGIRAIDGLLPCGKGQRIGIFGGSGVGKSTLLGAMSRHNRADVTVIAMIGERNREVRGVPGTRTGSGGTQAVGGGGRDVGSSGAACACAPASWRLAVAEYFRDQGKNVLLVMDSVTRLAMAQREIGLAAGEPPSQKGYTPSVFKLLPKIFERARAISRRDPSRASSRCWWKATISTSRSATRCAAFWTGISFCRAPWPPRILSRDRRTALDQPAGEQARRQGAIGLLVKCGRRFRYIARRKI